MAGPAIPSRLKLGTTRWSMPAYTVSVAPPSRWSNPYQSLPGLAIERANVLFAESARGRWVPKHVAGLPHDVALAAYEAHLAWLQRIGRQPSQIAKAVLRGKNLACRCDLCAMHENGKPM